MFHFILFFLCFNTITEIPVFVKEFHSVKTKKAESNFILKYEDSKNASINGYVISLKMKQAKYKFFPWEKLAIFRAERSNLELLIKKNPNNLHLRYLRLVIQESTPKFLNYFSNIELDKKIINQFLLKKDKTDYLDKYIINNTSL